MEARQIPAGGESRPVRTVAERARGAAARPNGDVHSTAAARRLALQDELDRLARYNAESGLEVLTLVAFLLALTAALLSPSLLSIAAAVATFGFGTLLLASGLDRWRRMNELQTLLADADRSDRSRERIFGD